MIEVRDALMRLRQLSSSGVLCAQSPLASGIMSQPVLLTSVSGPAASKQPAAAAQIAKPGADDWWFSTRPPPL